MSPKKAKLTEKSPLTRTQLPTGQPFWIVDGEAYDFTDWIKKHPGGSTWFKWAEGRDISLFFHCYHRDPQKLKPILEPYRIEGRTPQDLLPKMGLPPFIIDSEFDARRDLPHYDFSRSSLLQSIRQRLRDKLPEPVMQRYHLGFDSVIVLFAVLHLVTLYALTTEWWPAWLCVLLWVVTRTALAGGGHYYIHRRKRNAVRSAFWGDKAQALFDVNYVGGCLTAVDGHVLLHHPHLDTGADVKRTFFGGMLRLPPGLRILGYTLHKFGVFLSGMQIRGYEVNFLERDPHTPRLEFWFMRLWLWFEFILCIATGHILAWFAQFFITLWVNTFMVVSSHDFEGEHTEEDNRVPEALRDDWAARQICHSYDLSITGNRWLDVFLSAGLSPHRVHHALPDQASGFANIASEEVVREVCEENGIAWQRPRNFVTGRLPVLARYYLLSTTPDQVKQTEGVTATLKTFFSYVRTGFKGAGAI